jgi:hypothetical protein
VQKMPYLESVAHQSGVLGTLSLLNAFGSIPCVCISWSEAPEFPPDAHGSVGPSL